MSDEVRRLVAAAGKVLSVFRSGNYPSFGQLEQLDRALAPFTTDKNCEHNPAPDSNSHRVDGLAGDAPPQQNHVEEGE